MHANPNSNPNTIINPNYRPGLNQELVPIPAMYAPIPTGQYQTT